MININSNKCTGCGNCVDVCTHQAISINGGQASVNQSLCRQCGICMESCPVGAISEKIGVNEQTQGGEEMVYGFGRGFNRGGSMGLGFNRGGGMGLGFNRGGGSGFGFRGYSPAPPYVGRGRGGLPRCQYPGAAFYPQMTQVEELDSLKNQAQALKEQLERIEARIDNIETSATK